MSRVASLTRRLRPTGGRADPDTGLIWSTPGAWRTAEGVYVADGRVWLYWRLPLASVHYEDAARRYEAAEPLKRILTEIGDTARTSPLGEGTVLSRARPVHLLAVMWDAAPVVPAGASDAQRGYLEEALSGLSVPGKAVYFGVELWPEADTGSVGGALRAAAATLLGDDVPELEPYRRDRAGMEAILGRWGARRLGPADNDRLESWYNDARGPDVTVVADRHRLLVDDHEVLEFAGLASFDRFRLDDPDDQWLAAAFTHPERTVAVSIRGELQRPEMVRARARRVQRRVRAQIEEQARADDLERVEDLDLAGLAKEIEDHFATGGEPVLSRCSIVMARRARRADRTYIDLLRSAYGIRVRPLVHRQLPALGETLPGATGRATRFEHDLLVGMVAHAGLTAWSGLGDDRGPLLGLVLPDLVPCHVDPTAASRRSKPPGFVVVGEPGGGKTFTLQSLAHQAVLDGHRVVMINPKTDDDLSPLVDLLHEEGRPAERVWLSDLQAGSGAFDPWRFAKTPEAAAEMAAQHITNVLDLDQERYVALKSGLVQGARLGARCVMEALELGAVTPATVDLVRNLAESTPLFRLGVGLSAPGAPGAVPLGDGPGLTLVQFDQPIELPDPATPRSDYLPGERAAIAALRLLFRAATELLLRRDGGVLIVDEAWTFMASREGLSALHKIGREGRSQQVLPILATQRLADVSSAELLSYVSRVLVLKMRDPDEARAALELCGLEPTDARLRWLAEAGPVEPTADDPGRPPAGILRDLDGRHAGVLLGPIPVRHQRAFATGGALAAGGGR